MPRVDAHFDSPDPVMKVLLRSIQEIPDTEPERHDAEGFLHMTLAKASWRHADQLRAAAAVSTPDPEENA